MLDGSSTLFADFLAPDWLGTMRGPDFLALYLGWFFATFLPVVAMRKSESKNTGLGTAVCPPL
jgi:hypothetical protein